MHILKNLSETISLSRAVVPILQGYEDAGDFTVAERLKTSVHVNLVFYLCVGSIGLFGLILLIVLRKDWFVPLPAKLNVL
ncbi:LMBR1-like membrane protein [Actinidia rufa]|uniref:LMBR1-like membrane protein n=1 Tax=Actinidia rufa TaxID=165716 RepID=A0A7J0EVQ6_9ERIC|nr:LMBR1-like membrane protein [Actinidia rufa]